MSTNEKKVREPSTRPTGRIARSFRRSLAALGALTLALSGTVGVAQAAEPDPGGIRFSVTTASPDGPDKRRIFDFVAEPGEQIQDQVAVSNHGTAPVTFAMVTNDGIFTPMGKFDIRTSDQEPRDSGGWFDVQPTVDVPPGETVVVPFIIVVPQNVTPGDHPAGIVATVTTASSSAGPGVGVESRVGVRVNLRIPGEVVPSVSLANVSASYTPSWNPFAPGDVHVTYEVSNDGNLTVGGEQSVRTAGPFGIGATTVDRGVEGVEELIPGTSRTTSATVAGIWPIGPITTEVVVTPQPTSTDGALEVAVDAPLTPVTVTVTTWAVPWVQLLLVALGALAVLGIRDNRKRKNQRLDALLAKARAEGRAAATEESAPMGGPATGPAASPVAAAADPSPEPEDVSVAVSSDPVPSKVPTGDGDAERKAGATPSGG